MYGHVENNIKNCDIIIHSWHFVDVKVMLVTIPKHPSVAIPKVLCTPSSF